MFYYYIIFSYLLLDEKMYKHRVVSIIVISICFLVLSIKDFFGFEFGSFLILLMLNFCYIGILIFGSILIKIHFNSYLTDPFYFMYNFGLFGLLLLLLIEIIYQIIYHFVFDGITEILDEGIFYHFKSVSCTNFLLQVFFVSCSHISEIYIMYHFTPCHLMIINVILLMIMYLSEWRKYINEFHTGNQYIIVFIVVVMIIIFISLLIYCEIIIIKLCSMEQNTAKYISIRGKKEYENLDKNCTDDEDEEFNRDSLNY